MTKHTRALLDIAARITTKEDLRKLSAETLAAKTIIEKSSLTHAAKYLFLDDLDIALRGLDERITHLGDPSTGLATTTEIPMPPEPISVEYEIITGPHMGWSATYENEEGGTEQITDGVGRWKKKLQVTPGSYLSLSVQNSEDFGSIYVYITVKGEQVKKVESQGAYCIASTSYTVPGS